MIKYCIKRDNGGLRYWSIEATNGGLGRGEEEEGGEWGLLR